MFCKQTLHSILKRINLQLELKGKFFWHILIFSPLQCQVCVWQWQTTALKSLYLKDFRFSFKINILIHLHFYLFACALCICHFSFAMTHTFPTSYRYSLRFFFFFNRFSSSHLVFSFFCLQVYNVHCTFWECSLQVY